MLWMHGWTFLIFREFRKSRHEVMKYEQHLLFDVETLILSYFDRDEQRLLKFQDVLPQLWCHTFKNQSY